jgi:very-long-chain enoyl-CoA reductase
MKIKLTRKQRVLLECEVDQDLIPTVAKKLRLNANRIRLLYKQKVIEDLEQLKGEQEPVELECKDLGPQISWLLVFVLEYLGPILIHLFFFLRLTNPTPIQYVSVCLACLHFIKREYETWFVHRFSNGTMPFMNLPKNCFHYWVLGGLFVSYFVYQPGYQPLWDLGSLQVWVLGTWVLAQASNYVTHCTLRDLRPPGSKERRIPYGYGFDWVSCPNYTFEILGWMCYSLLVQHWSAWFFTIVGGVQMYFWAVKKHKRYRKEFKEYPVNRKVLIPGLL